MQDLGLLDLLDDPGHHGVLIPETPGEPFLFVQRYPPYAGKQELKPVILEALPDETPGSSSFFLCFFLESFSVVFLGIFQITIHEVGGGVCIVGLQANSGNFPALDLVPHRGSVTQFRQCITSIRQFLKDPETPAFS